MNRGFRTMLRVALICLAVFAWTLSASAQSYYLITDLGTLGGASSTAAGINSLGQVCGSAARADGTTHAFLWSSGVMTDLGTLGGQNSGGYAVNASGQVAGYANTSVVNPQSPTGTQFVHAALFKSGQVIDLDTQDMFSSADALNDAGVACGSIETMAYALYQAAVFSNGIVTVPDLNSASSTVFTGISADGVIVGNSSYAFYYENGAVVPLGQPGDVRSATAINQSAEVAGYGTVYNSSLGRSVYRAVTYDNGVTTLGLPGGATDTLADALNNSGDVVGYAIYPGGAAHAALYTDTFGTDLNARIAPFLGWSLQQATGINDAGQIVGYGTISGQQHAFLLTPAPANAIVALGVSTNPVSTGARLMGEVALSTPAPAGGTKVFLTNDSPALLSVPHGVTVPAGQRLAMFTITAAPGVTSAQMATLTATAGGLSSTATVTVTPVKLLAAAVSPGRILGGQPATGTVVLSGPAPAGGAVITLSSDLPSSLTLPSTVTVPAGASSATFPVTSLYTAGKINAHVTAAYAGQTVTAGLFVEPLQVDYLASYFAGNVQGGTPATLMLGLNGPAPYNVPPSGGAYVQLTSSNPMLLNVPSSPLDVPGGQSQVMFTLSTQPVTQVTPVQLTASYNGLSYKTTVTLLPTEPVLSMALAFDPSSTLNNLTITLKLAAPAAQAQTILLNSAPTGFLSLPASLLVAPGQQYVTLTTTAPATADLTPVTITALLGTAKAAQTLVLRPLQPAPPAAINLVALHTLGTGDTGTVVLGTPAPSGGFSVMLKSSNPALASVPATVVVPAGQTQATFAITPSASSATVTIYALSGSTVLSDVYTAG